jgi:hypothetical protein
MSRRSEPPSSEPPAERGTNRLAGSVIPVKIFCRMPMSTRLNSRGLFPTAVRSRIMTKFDRRNAAPPPDGDPDNLRPHLALSVRDTLVLTLTTATGVAAGFLAHLAGQDTPAAVMMGTSGAGAAMLLFDKVIGK